MKRISNEVDASEPTKLAKLFETGRGQAVSLPAEYRFTDCDAVEVYRDIKTGDIILSKPSKTTFYEFIELLANTDVPSDFMDENDRYNPVKSAKDLG